MNLLDARGHKCPLPVLKAQRALSNLKIGDQLEVWTDDPNAPIDLKVFCETTGHLLIEETHGQDSVKVIIEKTAL